MQEPAQRRDRQPLLEDQRNAEESRLGAAHREIVDRTVDGERADVAARELERSHDIAVGRERERPVNGLEHGAVMAQLELGIVERGPDHGVEQPQHRTAAAAVRELHDLVVVLRQRAGVVDGIVHDAASVAARGPRNRQ